MSGHVIFCQISDNHFFPCLTENKQQITSSLGILFSPGAEIFTNRSVDVVAWRKFPSVKLSFSSTLLPPLAGENDMVTSSPLEDSSSDSIGAGATARRDVVINEVAPLRREYTSKLVRPRPRHAVNKRKAFRKQRRRRKRRKKSGPKIRGILKRIRNTLVADKLRQMTTVCSINILQHLYFNIINARKFLVYYDKDKLEVFLFKLILDSGLKELSRLYILNK